MNKEFVPYEQALTLKELGFDEPCFGYYYALDNKKIGLEMYIDVQHQDTYFVQAPLYQQAFRWFREKYNLFGNILSIGERSYEWRIQNIKFLQNRRNFTLADVGGGQLNNTYEEAELECLKKLIELCQNK